MFVILLIYILIYSTIQLYNSFNKSQYVQIYNPFNKTQYIYNPFNKSQHVLVYNPFNKSQYVQLYNPLNKTQYAVFPWVKGNTRQYRQAPKSVIGVQGPTYCFSTQSIICLIPYKFFPLIFNNRCVYVYIYIYIYIYMCVCQLLPKNRCTHYKILIKVLLKQYPVVTSLNAYSGICPSLHIIIFFYEVAIQITHRVIRFVASICSCRTNHTVA